MVLNRRLYQVFIDKKKRTYHLADLSAPVDPSKDERRRKHRKIFVFCLRAEKMWNTWVMVILIEVGSLGTVLKGLEKRLGKLWLRGKIETI